MFEEEGTARTKLLTHLGFSVPNEGSESATDEIGKKLTNTLSFDEKASKGALFEGEEGSAFLIDNGEDFFNNPQPSENNFVAEDNEFPNDKQIKKEQEEHLEGTDPSIDESIQRALVVGDYKGAVLQCMEANRMADALVIAHVGGPSLWEITRDQYLKKSPTSYLKVWILTVCVSKSPTHDKLFHCLQTSLFVFNIYRVALGCSKILTRIWVFVNAFLRFL